MMIKIRQMLNKIWKWPKKKLIGILVVTIFIGISLAVAADPPIPLDRSFENLPNVAKEQGLYRVTFDQWSNVEIKDQDMPEVKLRKWQDETYIKISYPDFHPVNPKQDKGKLKWVNGNKEVHLYPLEPREITENGQTFKQLEQGGFEFEIILKQKPATNVITLNIETKGLKFYYQPPLTQKKIDKGMYGPENVMGSYMVYHKTQDKFFKTQEEGDKYKAGVFGIIYRPKIIDSNGWEVWGDLNIDEQKGELTVIIPQDFIDNAIYPVKHSAGATFGYEVAGPIGWDVNTNDKAATKFNLIKAGNVSKLTTINNSYGDYCKAIIYNDDSGSPNGLEGVGVEETVFENSVGHWKDLDFAAPVYLSAGSYWLGIIMGPDATGAIKLKCAVGDANQTAENTDDYSTGPSDPFGSADRDGYKLSIYATYAPSADITTDPVSNVASTTAQFNATLELNTDTSANVYFDYGTTSSPLIAVTYTASTTPITYTASTSATTSVTLTTLQTYDYRAQVTSTLGANTGDAAGVFFTADISDMDYTLAHLSEGTFASSSTITIPNTAIALSSYLIGSYILKDTEDFESSMGDWTDVACSGCTSECWTRDSGGTPSSNTGPDDGQENTGSAWYMFTEASSDYCFDAGDEDYIEYTLSEATAGYVDFYYHMYGVNTGTLSVDSYDGSWNNQWATSGQKHSSYSDPYSNASTTFPPGTTKIRFRMTAVGGYESDMAVDVLKVYEGNVVYATSGSHINPALNIGSITNYSDSKITWSASTTGSTTTVQVYTEANTSSTTAPTSGWNLATSNQAIPDLSGDLSGKYLWVKQEFTTSDTSTTPYFYWITYGVNDGGAAPPTARRIFLAD